ncbi:MAG: hypothetical protein ACRDRB_21455, partial [Pseudonocardiaceae bacterium]
HILKAIVGLLFVSLAWCELRGDLLAAFLPAVSACPEEITAAPTSSPKRCRVRAGARDAWGA